MNATPTIPVPHLVSDLRIALATLYTLPGSSNSHCQTQPLSSSHAHEYLLQFQERNPRRKVHSQFRNLKENQQPPTLDPGDVGSTWLACIDILSSFAKCENDNHNHNHSDVHYTEALFAAQTLVHRLRRVKLSEAIDIEFEPHLIRPPSVFVSPEQILDGYRRWSLECYHAKSSFSVSSTQLVRNYQPSIDAQQPMNSTETEERVKGEISMILISSIMDCIIKACYNQRESEINENMHTQMRPLLKTMASILAVIAARMRFVSTSVPKPAPGTQPIVTTILEVMSMVQPTQQSGRSQEAFQTLCYTSLTALPEAVLTTCNNNSGGGAYGRLSLDPRCYAEVTKELKTQGTTQVCQSVQQLMQSNLTNESTPSLLLLQMCEAWARYVPLPIEFVNTSVPLVLRSWQRFYSLGLNQPQVVLEAKAAMSYWIALMESGTWTVEQVLTSSLVQTKESSRQSNKKRQSSKSKKRHQQFLEEKTTDELLASAHKEVQHRGEVACTMAQQTLSALQELLAVELRGITTTNDQEQQVQGDGPVGAITACANACLPFLVCLSTANEDRASIDLFACISESIQKVCSSPSRMVRSFAAESLFSLHEALIKSLTDNSNISKSNEFLKVVSNHFFESSINLALQCGYPMGYFNDLGEDNDDELESERNDVREVLRTASFIPSVSVYQNATNPVPLILTTSSILFRITQACALSIQEAMKSNSLFPETALHTFSALAKPINSVSALYAASLIQDSNRDNLFAILKLSFEIISNAGRCLLSAFPSASMNEILPLSRLYNLAVASLSPTFSTLCQIPDIAHDIQATVAIGIEAAATSLLKLPELTGPSTLRQTRFDIRGAMRSPGGEDHVGVLTLMRLAKESESLSFVFLKTNSSILVDLCGLYKELKKIEDQRGVGIFYGVGVLPKSRRILLNIICHLELVSKGTAMSSTVLEHIFENAITSIADIDAYLESLDATKLSHICENTFDLAAFSPNVTHSLFAETPSSSLQARCLRVLHHAGALVFKLQPENIPLENVIQWNRLRAALFTLLKTSGNPDIPNSVLDILISLITNECQSVICQCSAGPTSPSVIFHEDIISEDNIPSGIFIRVIYEVLEQAFSKQIPFPMMQNALQVLYATRLSVIRALISECPTPVQKGSFEDPRPMIAETWLLCMNQIAIAVEKHAGIESEEQIVSAMKELLVETFVVMISLLLYASLEKTQEKRLHDPGMSLDGPQGLVMMKFFEVYFNLGYPMIQAAAEKLVTTIPVAKGHDPATAGIAVIGAALFRGSQGGLPPWAVESVPSIYSSLYTALGKNVHHFGVMLEISMDIRLLENQRFGNVQSGSLISGRFFEKMSDKSKRSFIDQAKELAEKNTVQSWRRLKTLIKQACGGKKKDTDYNQRPALTSWDTLDRV